MNLLQEHLSLISTQFHLLRPWWLLALVPLIALSFLLWKQKRHAYQWQDIIAPELLPYLLDGKTMSPKKTLLWGLIFGWLIASIALAGPSWVKRPTPVEKNQNALVILLDLSISMYSEDIKPSRIARARLKITDILRERKDGQSAIVVYAGEAHTVTPLSDDIATIVSLLPSLQPSIMPTQGSNTEAAIARGIQLLKDAGATEGDLLLVTDGIVPQAFAKIRELVSGSNIHISILGVGTNQPTPVPGGNGGFLHDKQGAILTTQLNSAELSELATKIGGRYHDIANTNSDINYLMPAPEKDAKNSQTLERDFDQWFDQGHWLVFLLLPIVLFSFRRGFILMFICIPLIGLTPTPVYAFTWDDLWLTKDQQAAKALDKGDAKAAAEKFETPDWKASAEYRTGNYTAAAENYAKSDTAVAHYNRGNALAKAGKLEDAIKAYDEALKRDASLEDAKTNKALVEKLLQQQKDQKESSDQEKKDQDEQNKDQNSSGQTSSDQNSSGESQDEKNRDQQNSSGGNASAQNQDQNSSQSSTDGDSQQSAQGQQSSGAASSAQANATNSSAADSTSSEPTTQASSQASDDKNEEKKQQAAALNENNLTDEQKQALEQWLRRVPDDPGGLLRNKFKWQYLQNRQKKADGEFVAPQNNADERL